MADGVEVLIRDCGDPEAVCRDVMLPEPKYCMQCGNEDRFGLLGNYASSSEWRCKDCGEVFQWSRDD